MNLAIWGAGKRGEWFYNLLMDSKMPLNVVCYGDNNMNLIGTKKAGVPILSFNEVVTLYRKHEIEQIVVVTQEVHLDAIIQQMLNTNVEELYMVPEFLHFAKLDNKDIERYMVKVDYQKPRLRYIEYHVCDHCNLNCKGCGHLCPLVKEPVYANLEQYVKDLERLKELCWGIKQIRLMGGEPLLNDQLPEFILESRRIFPDARISVVSNGLLFSNASKRLLEIMKTTRCCLEVSLYKPTERMIDKIKIICEENQIACFVSEPISVFFKKLNDIGNENVLQTFENCESKTCHFLRDGKISVCGLPLIIHIFNREYGTEFPTLKEDVIDLYDEKLDGWMLVDRLNCPVTMCKYCKAEPEVFMWTTVGAEARKYDWLVD